MQSKLEVKDKRNINGKTFSFPLSLSAIFAYLSFAASHHRWH